MSVRQYIGARYVTKIYENSLDPSSAEWEGGRAYEPLTLVTYLNSSYLSKKEVPASVGDPASNPDYWVITGAYNGQIAQLQNDVSDLQNDVASINSPTLRNMSERKFVFIGDSYTQVPTPDTSSIGKAVSILGLAADQYHNIGVSGVDMNGFITQVTGYAYSDADEITDVVVTGGINDAHSDFLSSTLSSTIPALINAIRATFPNAVIWAGFSGGGYYTNLSGSYPNFTYNNVQNIKYLWEKHFSESPYVIYMDRLDEWFRNLIDTDYYVSGGSGLHPDGFGIEVLGEKIANFLKGGASFSPDLTCGSYLQLSINVDASLWTGSSYLFYDRINSLEYIKIFSGGANLNTTITLSSTPMTLFTQPQAPSDNAVACMRDAVVSTPLYYTVTGDSTLKSIMASFIFSDKEVKLSTPTALVPITDINSIWYPDLEFVLPANAV